MRSFWMRNAMITSAPRMPSASESQRFAPGNSSGSGARLAGETKRSSPTPSVCRAVPVERATREWLMSPTIATLRFCTSPLRCRIVSTSSRPCVGCETCASPAFSTLTWGCTWAATKAGRPGSESRMTKTSAIIACSV